MSFAEEDQKKPDYLAINPKARVPALVTDDGKTLYPVNDGIPVLLEGESVVLDQL